MFMNAKGFTLLETIVYIAIFALLIPSFMSIILGFVQKSHAIEMRVRLEEKASLIRSELQYELTQAKSIDITHSTLGTNTSTLVFKDPTNASITIERVEDSVAFQNQTQTVHRLQEQVSSGNEWMTDADMEVSVWKVEAVRNSLGVLTGLNAHLTIQMLNPDGSPYRDIELTTDTTIHLQPQTTEL